MLSSPAGVALAMDVVVLGHEEVESLLPMHECIELMSEALSALARNEAYNPLRVLARPPDSRHFLGLMPAYRGGGNPAYALKEVCIFPDNPSRGLDTHQGAVLLHSADTGQLLGIMNASAVTAIRTAAVSGLATKLLARDDSTELAIVGTGVQARAHLQAMSVAGRFERARIAGRSPERARAFAAEVAPGYGFRVEPSESVEAAVRDADVIVTATNAVEPVVRREWIKPGAHINAVGSCSPKARELDTATLVASTLFVDRRESTLNESGDYLLAAAEGAIGPAHVRAELGELLIGQELGRTFDEEITVFKSLGIAIEDLAAAQFLYRRALEKNVGARVRF
jgi:ornithine cyclodeaminase/alanine dehydrogenase-like protein (mu-crystallin family)